MAGPRDVRRETIRIRREQAKRNAEAQMDKDRRVTEMEKFARNPHRASSRERPTPKASRSGHRMIYAEPGTLAGVVFSSPASEKRATDSGLTWEDFAGLRPSGESGYTAGDVRTAKANKKDREKAEDKMDRGKSGVEDKRA